MNDPLLQTICRDWHVERGAKMAPFGGWDMPIQHTGIVQEHHAVRKACGLFDIAHMGRVFFRGTDACRLLDHLLTNDVSQLQPGQVRYSLVTNHDGFILDDVLVYRLDDGYMLVVNASNRVKIVDWISEHQAGFDVDVQDKTTDRFMLALQGPKALSLLQSFCETDLSPMPYYSVMTSTVAGKDAIVSRTGYTGEDGFEVIVPANVGLELWQQLVAAGDDIGLVPCGLGCRDTLRLEAAMPLYGHELNEDIDPFTAGLSFAVKLNAADFIGRSALLTAKANPERKKRIGLALAGRRVARDGMEVFSEDREIGRVTSGTFSPTFEKPVAMAYVSAPAPEVGSQVEVQIRNSREPATVVKLPFYKRS
ncbi:MAG: glycine cleavage system protein T [Planctomycetaceae bacterium]|nr:glycine cleavage system protein T [Planctomycetaceae bacterium]